MIRILVFKLALSAATAAFIAAAGAPMLVSVTVVRSCTVGTQSGSGVTLACSGGVNRVSVTTVGALTSSFSISTTSAPDIRTLGPGANSVDVPESHPVPRAEPVEEGTLAANLDPPVVVTFNF
jgi:hypothetical protein